MAAFTWRGRLALVTILTNIFSHARQRMFWREARGRYFGQTKAYLFYSAVRFDRMFPILMVGPGALMRKSLQILILCCMAVAAPIALAQSKAAFEVASVKSAAPLDMQKMAAAMRSGQMPQIGVRVDGQEARYTYMSMKQLVANAYGVKPYQVSGPDWINGERYDISAKIPDGASQDDAPKMLQSLLEQRFKLVAHRVDKQEQVLALVVAKSGPKMKESTDTPQALDDNAPLQPGQMNVNTPDGPARMTMGQNGTMTMNMGTRGVVVYKVDPATQSIHMEASHLSMAGLVDMLNQFSQMQGPGSRQIVDKTGLKGTFQVGLDFSILDLLNMARAAGIATPAMMGRGAASSALPGDAASEPSGTSSLNESVGTLGLKLENTSDTVQDVVVDSVEKTPTEN
jgi:uncharacterized protein (TIGR03435 family)